MPLPLSVLDLSPIPSGSTPGQALRNTIELGRHADELGLLRYWLAEHHNAMSLASSAPEIMIAQVAAATRRIRVGSGGMMLPNHSALRVAELFRVLGALFPGRIDLGIGRAAGTDPRTALALRRSHHALAGEDFPKQLDQLFGFLDADSTPRDPFTQSIVAIPAGVQSPEVFMLGSSDYGAHMAARLGLGYAFARHINPDDAVGMLQAYRSRFEPSRERAEPYAILALSAICAETDDEAEELASSAYLSGLRFAQGRRDLPLPSVAEALAYHYDADDEALRRSYAARHIVGSARSVAARACELCEQSGADELMVMTHIHDPAARQRSYTLLARELGVEAGPARG